MKPIFITLISMALLIPVFLIGGCTSIQIAQDYESATDFSGRSTFAWISPEQPATGDPRIDNPLRNTRIREAVERNLAAKGFQSAVATPQFQIQYQYLLQRSISSRGPTFGIGYGTGHRGHYGGFGVGTGGSVWDYDEGSLIIDFVDPATNELLWRGTGTHIYSEYKDPAKTTRDINQLVDKILSQFPPKS